MALGTAISFVTSEMDCSDVIHNETLWGGSTSIRCQLVNATESCIFNDGHIEYILGMYCTFKDVVPLGVTLMFLWLILMLIGLATTADVFFGPCLIVMADTMRLSQNVAGVTLLALGNGAPDIFSAISSITTLRDGDAGLAFGALLGAGIFVTSVTAGAIAIVKPFTAMSRPLLKDIVFYMLTIFWAFIIMFRQTITLVDSIGFIVLYALYVILTVVSRALYAKGIGTGSKEGQAAAAAAEVQGESDQDTSAAGSDAFRMRKRSDIQQDVGIVYADVNPAFEAGADSVAADDAAAYDPQQRESDAEAGYDTSLEFPGGLSRVELDVTKKPRSRRFQELNIHSSPKTSSVRRPSRLDERMKRVSRVQMQRLSRTTHESFGASDNSNVVSGGRKRSEVGRKVSTASFIGVERRANYLTRWMLVYGNLEQVEHRSRTPSQSSYDGGPPSAADVAAKFSPARSVSVARRQPSAQKEPTDRRSSDSDRPGSSGAGAMLRPGYKLSGGLRMDSADVYFNRKDSEQQARKLSRQQQQQQQQQKRAVRQSLPPPPQLQLEDEDDEGQQRHLYRIESVDEALDDDTVARLNRLNEQHMIEQRLRDREEREAAAAEAAAAEAAAAAAAQPEAADDDDESLSPAKEFLYSLVPVDLEEFPEMSWYNKIYEIVKAPLLFLLLLSTPCVDYDQPMNGWSRILNSVHCAIAPVFIALAFKGYAWLIPFEGGSFPVIVIVLLVGIVLGILVYCTSTDFEPPRYHAAFAFIGFLTAIVWIYTFANEVVNILESVGSIFRISSTILGLTVLAWANSIGDVISNTVLARQNFPRVAISACFGGPLFNLLLGVGIPFTIKLLSKSSTNMRIEASVVQLLLVVSVTASLIVSMVYLTVMRFKLGRVYGIILIVLYLVFLVIAMLAETGQLPPLVARG